MTGITNKTFHHKLAFALILFDQESMSLDFKAGGTRNSFKLKQLGLIIAGTVMHNPSANHCHVARKTLLHFHPSHVFDYFGRLALDTMVTSSSHGMAKI